MKRVSPEEAQQLMKQEGYVYVDVRSVPEFESGHPEGAYNVPIVHAGPRGMTPNPDFLSVMETAFGKDAKVVVGCQMGGRSNRAAMLLESAGFTNVADQKAGFDGPHPGEPGWRKLGLPVSREAAPDRTWEALQARKP